MRTYMLFVWFIVLSLLSAEIQSRSRQPLVERQGRQQQVVYNNTSSGQASIDPAKEADIHELLDLIGTKRVINGLLERMVDGMKPLMISSLPPGEYRPKLVDLFIGKFRSKLDTTYLLRAAVPIYDRYFSHEEIKGLIQFYATPLGQKALRVQPNLTAELEGAGSKWGEEAGKQCMDEVLTEHPELATALEAAQKAGKRR